MAPQGGPAGVIAHVTSVLTARRGTSAFPDESERQRVLVSCLEFAAAEASPGLFEAVIAEMIAMQVPVPDDNLLVSAYSEYDKLSRSGGDGQELEAGLDKFEQILVTYQGAPVRALEEVKQQLQCELRAQVCLGKLLPGPRESAQFTGELGTLKAFEAAVHTWFPEEDKDEATVGGAAGIARSKSPAAVAHEMAVREELQRVIELTRPAPKKGRKSDAEQKKADAAVAQAARNHDWRAFLHAVRLYVSVLLYEAYGGPLALRRVREEAALAALLPPPQAPAAAVPTKAVPPPKHQHQQQRARHVKPQQKAASRLAQLHAAVARAGKAEEFRVLTHASDEAGRMMLKQVLERAEEFAQERELMLEDEATKLALTMSDAVIYGQQPPHPQPDEDGREEEEGEEEEEEEEVVDDDGGGGGGGYRAAKRAKTAEDGDEAKRAPEHGQAYKTALAELDNKIGEWRVGSVGELRKPRKQAVPWTVEETEALKRGIELYGVGHWARIVSTFPNEFAANERTGPALKDRWRNLEAMKNRADRET
jgi:hypothetical protein